MNTLILVRFLVKQFFCVCVTEMEERNFEQRCAIKFCVKLGETGIETFNELKQAYVEHALSRSQVSKWYKAFSKGRESITDKPRSGRPSTLKTVSFLSS